MRSTFKVLFYLKKNAPKKNGSVPVMCRITIDGTIAQFSCKCDIHPDLWDIKSNRASGKSTVALETNRFLDKIRVGINAKYKEIAERDNYVTAEKVKNAFLGLEMRHETLLKVFAQHNEDFAKLLNAGLRSKSTYEKYCTVYKHLEEFIKMHYHVSDIALKELTPPFSLYSFRDVLLLRVVKRLLGIGISLQQIRLAINHLRERGVEDLTEITLLSDGVSVYECTNGNEIYDLSKGGQGMFLIALGGVWRDLEGELLHLPTEKPGSAAPAIDELAQRRRQRAAG